MHKLSPTPSSSALPALPSARLSLDDALASARETKILRVGRGLLAEVPAIFAREFPGRQALVVADGASFAVAGRMIQENLAAAGLAGGAPFVFPEETLPAEHTFVERLEAGLRMNAFVPVAVGSGTINDLVKLAAHRADRPYLCVATAASMDGYTAFGASITFHGAKQTFNCPAPHAVIADTAVICAAPPAMTAAGYADLLAKVTAGADWLVADALGVEAIDPRAWSIVQGGLRDALADPAGARAGREGAILPLVEGLMLSGFAMQWTKTSRPASGAEHQFSHLWDMEHHTHNGATPSHGFKVGIATLAVTALYEELLRRPIERLDIARCCARWPEPAEIDAAVRQEFVCDDFLPTAVDETQAKHISRAALQTQLERLRQVWPELRPRLEAQLIPTAELKSRLRAVGAPTEPEEIGITRGRLRRSFRRAQAIRRRFTVLELAERTGLLDDALDSLFGPGGRWESAPQSAARAAQP